MKEFRFSQDDYEIVLTPHGTGQSFWKGLALNRWNGDALAGSQGFFVYLRERSSGEAWCATPGPCLIEGVSYRGAAGRNGMAWEARHRGIASRLQVACASGGCGEVRQLELRNESGRAQIIELTSYLEVVLHHRDADAGHPAFQKLFVQTEWDGPSSTLLARRRARASDESWPWLAHRLSGAAVAGFETGRLRFLGRGRDTARPLALDPAVDLSNTVGNVLDACLSLRALVELAPGEARTVSFLLAAGDSRKEALSVGGEVLATLEEDEPMEIPELTPAWVAPTVPAAPPSPDSEPLRHFNGYGGFSADGREYVIRLPWNLGEPRWTPLPWVNCLANERCGMLVSESGAACTWARNSQANRLTPWNNDPVCDPHGEALYVRDEENGQFWSPLPGPAPAPASHEVRHGWGYSTFSSRVENLDHAITFFVPEEDPVRIIRWRLTNLGPRARRLSLVSFCRLVLGTQVPAPGTLVPGARPGLAALTATGPAWSDFRDGEAFASASVDGRLPDGWRFTCDRAAFLGSDGGGMRRPAALRSGADLGGECSAGLDACFAQQVPVMLEAGSSVEIDFFLGECGGSDGLALETILDRYRRPGAVSEALDKVKERWRDLLEGIRVETPAPELDVLLNGWLAYQAIACRIVGRTAFYQSGGAYGFRDQLQDAHGLALLRPGLAREQILRHAARQFEEGDVMHWWHPAPIDRGLRTRFSDDLLWLVLVTAAYASQTGDVSIWDERAPFLTAKPLGEGQDESYLAAELSTETGTVYDHCCRAVDRSLRTGSHGLPLMGSGDWNDGMNRVGRLGRGESVWMAFFLCEVLRGFVPCCRAKGEDERARRYEEHARSLREAIEAHAWDGGWYRRAYDDDGTPLGTSLAEECRIDGLVQSWAVISRAARPERAAQAMQAAWEELADVEFGVVRLLTPPFVNAKEDPGYIKGYVAGVRENGGQYTHAACWFVKALALLDRRDDAARALKWLSPVWHARSGEEADRYKVEPYVIAADIYHGAPHTGRGGWTWYTGSAAWCYRVAVETVLGLGIVNGCEMVLEPRIPDDWSGFCIHYRHGRGTVYHIEVANPQGKAARVRQATLDGAELATQGGRVQFRIEDDGASHTVFLALG